MMFKPAGGGEAGQSCACREYMGCEEGNGRYDIMVFKASWKQWVFHISVGFLESKVQSEEDSSWASRNAQFPCNFDWLKPLVVESKAHQLLSLPAHIFVGGQPGN